MGNTERVLISVYWMSTQFSPKLRAALPPPPPPRSSPFPSRHHKSSLTDKPDILPVHLQAKRLFSMYVVLDVVLTSQAEPNTDWNSHPDIEQQGWVPEREGKGGGWKSLGEKEESSNASTHYVEFSSQLPGIPESVCVHARQTRVEWQWVRLLKAYLLIPVR